ncbi:MAG: hemolysin III family protein [Clostridia bacterium]|nr:hemolysin III family protein [Clostridia bacterium]
MNSLKTPITLPPYTRKEEICNMVTHIVGGALGILALIFCVIRSTLAGSLTSVISSAVYGSSIILLFTMSSIYHGLVPIKAKKVFRVIDHCTIYLLIAGTYTPIVLVSLREVAPMKAWILFFVVWISAVVAIVLTAVDMHKFRVFSMIAYLAMGWCVLFCLKETILAVGEEGMWLIFIGGVLYTIGAVIYMIGKRNNVPYVHSVFHLFVLFACILHFFAIFFFVL